MTLAEFNGLDADAARDVLRGVCASPAWAATVSAARPYASVHDAYAAADSALAALPEDEVDLALAGHPRIGERSTHASSVREQAAVLTADAGTRTALAEGNAEYEQRFGHVYLVAAAGRGPDELLAVLRARLDNPPDVERRVLRGELATINRLRLRSILETEAK
ncbi:2-oxo-4-hydroxy-4-carboxy-5-ureidoimidazoline decarboxylase [Tsukamurella soli]|uniref:2-oxo-4-hydroxy-4-carboxy-5-ureidoimidazoline decarboxylase n=1 Tax=Tsukamurella soli TaxID=644556 RepID=A0ABP8JWQ0_9ACTN